MGMTTNRPGGHTRRARLRRVLVILAAVIAAAPLASAEDLRFFRIGTGASSGVFFPIGGLIANAISKPPGSRDCADGGSCGVPGLIAVAQSTEGAAANLEGIATRALESGIARADQAYRAFRGGGLYARAAKSKNKGKDAPAVYPEIRAIAALYPDALYVIVAAQSKVKDIADLKRKTVSIGPKESDDAATAGLILDAHGLKGRAVKRQHHTADEAIALLSEGKLDAVVLIAPTPSPRIARIAETFPIRLLPIKGGPVEALLAANPFFSRTRLQGDIYSNVAPVESLTIANVWLVSDAVDPDLVKSITASLWHDNTLRVIARGQGQAVKISLAGALEGIAIPLHPGAEAYYRSKGMLKTKGAKKPAPDNTRKRASED